LRDVGPYNSALGKCLFNPSAEQRSCVMIDVMGRKSFGEKKVFTRGYIIAGSITDSIAIHFAWFGIEELVILSASSRALAREI
jgi:hypothetical protein